MVDNQKEKRENPVFFTKTRKFEKQEKRVHFPGKYLQILLHKYSKSASKGLKTPFEFVWMIVWPREVVQAPYGVRA